MTDIRDIILLHAAKYPVMRPVDFAKLCYQSVYGVSHFVSGGSIVYLRKEYEDIEKSPLFEPFVPIGGNAVRVNLQPLESSALPVLADCFEATARNKRGSREELVSALNEVRAIINESPEKFGFSGNEFHAYLKQYALQGYPAVGHSMVYRAVYKPAYRVIDSSFLPLLGYSPLTAT